MPFRAPEGTAGSGRTKPFVIDSDWLRLSRARRGAVAFLRLNNESGFFKINHGGAGWTAEFCRNFHYVTRPQLKRALTQLKRLGWLVDPKAAETPGTRLASMRNRLQTFRRFRAELSLALDAILPAEDGEAYVDVDAQPLRPIPHAYTFWDWKQPPPFKEFEKAANWLIGRGAERIYFTESAEGGDTYWLMISNIRPSNYEADRYCCIASWEMPTTGGRLTFCDMRSPESR
jgi:hypothetical protein